MIYTILISRNLSSVIGQSNGIGVGQIFQICEGDCVADFDSKDSMTDVFYWKTVELTQEEFDLKNAALANMISDGEGGITPQTEKLVLDCFSAQDLIDLAVRGPLAQGIGGPITAINLVIENI